MHVNHHLWFLLDKTEPQPDPCTVSTDHADFSSSTIDLLLHGVLLQSQ
jgi:hypothetical protein